MAQQSLQIFCKYHGYGRTTQSKHKQDERIATKLGKNASYTPEYDNGWLTDWMNEWWPVFSATILHCKAVLGQGQPGQMRWILVWNMPQVQGQFLKLLTCFWAYYHCAITANSTRFDLGTVSLKIRSSFYMMKYTTLGANSPPKSLNAMPSWCITKYMTCLSVSPIYIYIKTISA